jgi:hypothetical protein
VSEPFYILLHIAYNSHFSMCSISEPLRELLESCRRAEGGQCALISHVPFSLQGGSPWSLSINRIDNAKGTGYPIANVEVAPLNVCSPPPPLIQLQVTTRAANLLVGNLPRTRIQNLLRFDTLAALHTYAHFTNAHQVHVPTHRWRSVRPNPSSYGAAEGAACVSTRGAFNGFL